MADVITMPNSLATLAERIKTMCKYVVDSKEVWIKVSIELAMAFAEARQRLPNTNQYYKWVIENELDIITRDDRHALVSMARDIELAKIVLQETQRTSWVMIWREEMQPRLRSVTTSEIATTELATAAEPAPKRRKAETEPSIDDAAAAARLILALDALVQAFDGLDLAAARRGMISSQRKHANALKKRVRNWLDILEISR